MKTPTISNNCRNCAYFVKHYANLHGDFYEVVGCMHCINQDLTTTERTKRMHNLVVCEYWQPMQIQVQQRREDIQETLQDMSDCLKDIATILKEDNKNN